MREREPAPLRGQARRLHQQTGESVPRFAGSWYAAEPWLAPWRVVGKAEYGDKGRNRRFVLPALCDDGAEALYRWHGERGQAEHDTANLKRGLRAERLSCTPFLANWLRLLAQAAAYRLLHAPRRQAGKRHAELATVQLDTLWLRLLQVAVLVSRADGPSWAASVAESLVDRAESEACEGCGQRDQPTGGVENCRGASAKGRADVRNHSSLHCGQPAPSTSMPMARSPLRSL